ncbi:RND transporter [Beggiatoa alba]|nr:RND transporter [Beggiatoa alba]
MRWLDSLSWPLIILVCFTLGLAPFVPEPHVIEKLTLLFNGELSKPIDIFDLFMHGSPWLIFLLKISRVFAKKQPLN